MNAAIDLIVLKKSDQLKVPKSSKINIIKFNCKRMLSAIPKLFLYFIKSDSTAVISVIRDVNIVVALSTFTNRRKIIFREANTFHLIEQLSIIKKYFYLKILKLAYKKSNQIIANSVDTKRDLIRFKVSDDKKITVIHNPVIEPNADRLIQQKIQHPWFSKQYCTLLSVGKLRIQKNYPLLLEAFSQISKQRNDLRLIIIGDGPEKRNIISLIREFEIDEFVDIIPYVNNPYPYYKNTDCFVLTSDWEGFGNVVVEALYAGAKVIVSNCPGAPKEIVGNGRYGTVFEASNSDSLINAINENIINNKKIIPFHEFEKYKLSNVSKSYSKFI